MGFGHLLNVPIVAASSSGEFPWISSYIGNDDNLAYVTNPLLQNFDKTRFMDRLNNFITYHWTIYKFRSKTEKSQTELMRKYLSPDIPNLRDVEKSVALFLINSHRVTYGAKPLIPSLIEVGGVTIEENTGLPKVN